jgi:aconitate hydratase
MRHAKKRPSARGAVATAPRDCTVVIDTRSSARAPQGRVARDLFDARRRLAPDGPAFYAVDAIADRMADGERLPVTLRILLENALRHAGCGVVSAEHVELLATWRPAVPMPTAEIPFMPSRVLLQDYTGVPAIVDLAALRDAVADAGGDPTTVRPRVPVDLVIDHSLQVDLAGSPDALAANMEREYERNEERYGLLRWAQQAFPGLRVVPPGRGIVHQLNLELLGQVVRLETDDRGPVATPDTVVGTDSHTTMVDALGVLGYGVGGIEAEAVLLGLGLSAPAPRVVGVRLTGSLPGWSTATDLALSVTETLRGVGVVGSFVEFTGDGVASLSVSDRATVSNMAPEYGATAALFPIDTATLEYLRTTGRAPAHVALVERYAKTQRLWRAAEPSFDELVEIDLATVEPSMAGPRRPQDRVALADVPRSFAAAFPRVSNGPGDAAEEEAGIAREALAADGAVVIAAITSCTNTSNAELMVTAALLARNAVARGLRRAPWV